MSAMIPARRAVLRPVRVLAATAIVVCAWILWEQTTPRPPQVRPSFRYVDSTDTRRDCIASLHSERRRRAMRPQSIDVPVLRCLPVGLDPSLADW